MATTFTPVVGNHDGWFEGSARSFGEYDTRSKGDEMKRQLNKTLSRTVQTAVLLVTIPLVASGVQGGDQLGGGRLEGTWDVRVSVADCVTGEEIRSFDSLGIFMRGGTTIDSTSGVPQALKTPGQGIWSHVGANTYRFKFKAFSFDPAGDYTGYQIIEHEAYLDATADAYESAGTAEFYTPDGFLLFTLCSTTSATRFNFD
jgi:hypothetical protein